MFAIVGESGSGKSVTAMSILGLIPNARRSPAARRWWKETDLLKADEPRCAEIRGGEIAMIFQDPLTALNPVHTVGHQIGEMVRIHRDASQEGGRASGRSSCSTSSASRKPERRVDSTRTSSPAACASGR